MERITYPERETISAWIAILKEEDPIFKLTLPVVDEFWADHILSIIELVRLPYYPVNLHHQVAQIFYKIIKDHNYVDSNKRSAIVIFYLIYLINGCVPNKHLNIKKLAKQVARSSARRHEIWVDRLETIFRVNTINFERILSKVEKNGDSL